MIPLLFISDKDTPHLRLDGIIWVDLPSVNHQPTKRLHKVFVTIEGGVVADGLTTELSELTTELSELGRRRRIMALARVWRVRSTCNDRCL
jgi:hypothetical protein